MDGKELQQNKNHAITKEIIWNVSVIILGIINVLVLCLLLTGILDNQYFPVMIVLFILLCIRLGISILEKQEDGFSQIKRASEYDYVKQLYTSEINLGDLWYSDYFG